jgi:hypothetical protein
MAYYNTPLPRHSGSPYSYGIFRPGTAGLQTGSEGLIKQTLGGGTRSILQGQVP